MAQKPKLFEYKGQMLTIRQLSELSGINYTTIYRRLTRMGLSVSESIQGLRKPKPPADHPWRQYGR